MTKIGKLWTGAVAYVSLLVGAGLSVAGNLADTYRTRGADVDNLDRVMAAGWPLLVLLAIEMFVSPRWSTSRMFQVWRWLGCLAVGGMAMVVSWTHLHDLMSSRGQLYVVSVLGPLAIDGMAIMATGLILSTRVRTLSRDSRTDTVTVKTVADLPMADMDGHLADRLRTAMSELDTEGHEAGTGVSQPVDPDWTWDIDAETELSALLSGNSQGQSSALPQRTRTPGATIPDTFRMSVDSWNPSLMSRADFKRTAADTHGVSVKTAGRWLDILVPPGDPRRTW